MDIFAIYALCFALLCFAHLIFVYKNVHNRSRNLQESCKKTHLREVMGDSRDRGLHSHYGSGYGGYGYNSGGGYGYPSAGNGGYPPVAYPPASGYPPQAYGQHHSGHGGLGAVAGYGAGHMMPHGGHGNAHGGYVAHGGGYDGHGYGYGGHHQGKFNHGKFGQHGGFKKWK